MTRQVDKKETVEQSNRAFKRWASLWGENADANRKMLKPWPTLNGAGKGKGVLLFAFGPSFKDNVRQVKNQNLHHSYDVMCVDKALKELLANRIIPKYVMIADAQVNFETYGNIDPMLCQRITLIATATSNPAWVKHWTDNGGKVYFTVNKDGIRTHKEYKKYFDYENGEAQLIPAASNVFNAAYVMASLFMGYSEILLFAADYSWKMAGKYYGNDSDPKDTNFNVRKHSFNNHYTMIDIKNELVQVSQNMHFSSRWLIDFVSLMEREGRNQTINCTGRGILRIPRQAIIEERMAA